jgi:tetratricopeptide (TPR) repeat protein
MSLDLARHYFTSGEYGRALPFFHQALAETTDSMPDIVFETGRAHEDIGDCGHALVFFERFRAMVRPWQRGEVDWYIGTCALNLASEIRAGRSLGPEELDQALTYVNRALAVGEPSNLMARAWFEKGEILSRTGDCAGAMDAYAQVRFADNAGAYIERAQQRFDEIRFGGSHELADGSCG